MIEKILLTGGTGFLGQALLRHSVFKRALVLGRRKPDGCRNFISRPLDATTDYIDILSDIDIIVHTAALAHIVEKKTSQTLADYRNVNTLTTLNLAEQAAAVRGRVLRSAYLQRRASGRTADRARGRRLCRCAAAHCPKAAL